MGVIPILCSSCLVLDEAPSDAKEVKKHLPEKQSTLPVCPQCSQVVLGELPVSPSMEDMLESLGKTELQGMSLCRVPESPGTLARSPGELPKLSPTISPAGRGIKSQIFVGSGQS